MRLETHWNIFIPTFVVGAATVTVAAHKLLAISALAKAGAGAASGLTFAAIASVRRTGREGTSPALDSLANELEEKRLQQELCEQAKSLIVRGAQRRFLSVGRGAQSLTVAQVGRVLVQALQRGPTDQVFLYKNTHAHDNQKTSSEVVPATNPEYLKECKQLIHLCESCLDGRLSLDRADEYITFQRVGLLFYQVGDQHQLLFNAQAQLEQISLWGLHGDCFRMEGSGRAWNHLPSQVIADIEARFR